MEKKEVTTPPITGAEVLYDFLTVARDELIYSVDIDDLIFKMNILKEVPEFASIKSAFEPIPQEGKPWFLSAIQSLLDSDKVEVCRNELMLTKSKVQEQKELSQETRLMYLQMAQLYRMIGTEMACGKQPKRKGI